MASLPPSLTLEQIADELRRELSSQALYGYLPPTSTVTILSALLAVREESKSNADD